MDEEKGIEEKSEERKMKSEENRRLCCGTAISMGAGEREKLKMANGK